MPRMVNHVQAGMLFCFILLCIIGNSCLHVASMFSLGEKWDIQQAKHLENTLPLVLGSKVAALNKPLHCTEESFDKQ